MADEAGAVQENGVRCDSCGCAFVPEVLTEKEDDIEYSFFRCDYCGKAFMVCVTDGKLRDMIHEYKILAERNRLTRLPEPEQVKMQKMKAENAARCRALMRAYIREADDGADDDGK